ncbi:MAG TPA: hypothetical protein VHM94_08090 [Acidimicrobiia bacterium]|nr:hypothetical protein [Acidimicrobiia bacterium]
MPAPTSPPLIGVDTGLDPGSPRRPSLLPLLAVAAVVGLVALVVSSWDPATVGRTEPDPPPPVATATTTAAVGPGLAGRVPGLRSDLVAVVNNSTVLELLRWPWDRGLTTRRFGSVQGVFAIDASGSGLLVVTNNGRLRAGNSGFFPTLARDVTSAAWHDHVEGAIAWTERAGDRTVIWANDRTRRVARIEGNAQLRGWGGWGFILGDENGLRRLDVAGATVWTREGAEIHDVGPGGRLILDAGEGEIAFADSLLSSVVELSWIPDHVTRAWWSPDGRHIALLLEPPGAPSRLEVWAMRAERLWSMPADPRASVDWSWDLWNLAVGGPGPEVRLLNVATGSIHAIDLGRDVIAVALRPSVPDDNPPEGEG